MSDHPVARRSVDVVDSQMVGSGILTPVASGSAHPLVSAWICLLGHDHALKDFGGRPELIDHLHELAAGMLAAPDSYAAARSSVTTACQPETCSTARKSATCMRSAAWRRFTSSMRPWLMSLRRFKPS